jgi:hypothetical protein
LRSRYLGLEQLELDPLPHPLAGFVVVLGIFELVGLVDHRLVEREVGLLLEQFDNHRQPLVRTLEEAIEDDLGELEVPLMDQVVELGGLGKEFVDVGLEKVVLERVKILQEGLAPFLRGLVVDGRLGHVVVLEQRNHSFGRPLILRSGRGCRRLSADHQCHDSQESVRRDRTQYGSGHGFGIPWVGGYRSGWARPGHTELS